MNVYRAVTSNETRARMDTLARDFLARTITPEDEAEYLGLLNEQSEKARALNVSVARRRLFSLQLDAYDALGEGATEGEIAAWMDANRDDRRRRRNRLLKDPQK